MKKINFDLNWEFIFEKSLPVTVNLPHDYSISLSRTPQSRMLEKGGYMQGGDAIYKKVLPKDLGEKVVLEVEGSYMNTEVYINENLAAFHPNGYTSFHADLTPWIKRGEENNLSIRVQNNALPNSRWYSGSGLYRHVWILTSGGAHIVPWGIFITTPVASENKSHIKIETSVEGEGVLRHTLVDAKGIAVCVCEEKFTSGKNIQEMKIENVTLWSPDNPYLYTLKSEVISDDKVLDIEETNVGIRSIALDKDKGFIFNGQPLNLKGGCVHHDCGILGSAAWDAAEERKVLAHKKAGYNSIRCAHNPPSPAFLDACDKHGIIVMDEAFDCWRMAKVPYDYHLYFDEWWQRDMASMVLRDRNHPCIAFWSTGNEIPERFGKSGGNELSKKLAQAIRDLDNTRYITNAMCAPHDQTIKDFIEESHEFTKPLDVVGYNYLWERYEEDLSIYPERFIFGTETIAAEAYENWQQVINRPRVIGDYVWTSMDYIGEAGIGRPLFPGDEPQTHGSKYPWLLANCGDLDITGNPRPQSIFRQILWGHRKAPWIAVHRPNENGIKTICNYWGWPDVMHSWSWPDAVGYKAHIDIYSDADEVELFVNGKSLGRKPAGSASKNTASFECTYEPGEVKAIAYTNNKKTGEDTIKTCAEPTAVLLETDKNTIQSTWGGLAYVSAKVVDKEGDIVPWASNKLMFSSHGEGKILAVGSADPMSEEPFTGNLRSAYNGEATIAICSLGKPGDIVITACADGLKTGDLTIKAI